MFSKLRKNAFPVIFIICFALLMNVGYFGHGRFGHGHFGQDISATDISAM